LKADIVYIFFLVIKKIKKYNIELITFLLCIVMILILNQNLVSYLGFIIILFSLNLFYFKLIYLSKKSYEEKLKKEKDYSQELLKSQKQFLRYAVHETNTPLAVIMANIELYELENGRHPVLSNIEAATKNIYGIYDDLSYMTKKNRVLFMRQEIDLSTFIQSRIEFFAIVANQSQLEFKFEDHTITPILLINETKLQRIIDNNITNAIKYTKTMKKIFLTLTQSSEHYIFKIESASTIIKNPQQIFNEYYRENSYQDGLGLGLRLVKNICEEEKIKIELHSDEQSTFFKYYFNKVER
jgi:signal transduction histidine kinase